MASKTFSLGENGASGACSKVLLLLILGAVIVAAVIIGIFAFKSSGSKEEGCGPPKLDSNGLSNYTSDASTIAFACFPGFFVDQVTPRNSNILISRCDAKTKLWEPQPPTCNFLPLRLDCPVDHHGLEGQISIIQMSLDEPTNIFGAIQFENAIKAEGHINEIILLSRQSPNCQVSDVYNITEEIDEIDGIDDKYTLRVRFESSRLAAYRQSEIHISMIFLDVNTTATLISCHQGDVTLVMPNNIPHYSSNSNSNGSPPTNSESTTTTVLNGTGAGISDEIKPRRTRDVIEERGDPDLI